MKSFSNLKSNIVKKETSKTQPDKKPTVKESIKNKEEAPKAKPIKDAKPISTKPVTKPSAKPTQVSINEQAKIPDSSS